MKFFAMVAMLKKGKKGDDKDIKAYHDRNGLVRNMEIQKDDKIALIYLKIL